MIEDGRVVLELDDVTNARLERFGKATQMTPAEVASRLLADLLADDEFWNSAHAEGRVN